jgi:hypothetical protein
MMTVRARPLLLLVKSPAARRATISQTLPAVAAVLLARDGGAARAFSTSSTELSPYQKLQKWLQPFVAGSKAMYQENKQAWAIRRRLKQDPSGADDQLSRREMMVLRQAHRDLLKSLPLLAFFCVPLAGYAAPVVGYRFPKQLLPWQFWRADQKTQFLREHAEAKAAHHPALVKLLLRLDDRDSHTLERMISAAAEDQPDKSSPALPPAQVAELEPFFAGPAALPRLPAAHVRTLARASIVSLAYAPPALANVVLALTPSATLAARLEKRADELRVDDSLLRKEGIDELSLSELEFACVERGLVAQYGDIEDLRAALREWLAMYEDEALAGRDAASDAEGDAAPLPVSLLLHAPALARFAPSREL